MAGISILFLLYPGEGERTKGGEYDKADKKSKIDIEKFGHWLPKRKNGCLGGYGRYDFCKDMDDTIL